MTSVRGRATTTALYRQESSETRCIKAPSVSSLVVHSFDGAARNPPVHDGRYTVSLLVNVPSTATIEVSALFLDVNVRSITPVRRVRDISANKHYRHDSMKPSMIHQLRV